MATLQPGEKARMFALGGVMRGGASRGGYVSGQVFIAIDGVHRGFGRTGNVGVIIDSLNIVDELDEAPNTCTFRVNGAVPAASSEISITLGSKNSGTKQFAGFALGIRQIYVGDKPANVQAEVSAVDYTWLFGFLKVTKRYRNQSATAIAQDLISTYAAANGFTAAGVAANLPVLDELTYTNEDLDQAFTRLARRIGAYWYVDYTKGVHLFFEEAGNGAPEPLTPTHRSLADFVAASDRTQVLTRVHVEGRGSSVLSAVNVSDTLIPLQAVDMFAAAADVFLKVSPQGSDGGAQHLTFTGVDAGGLGSLVGPGAGPPGAPALSPAVGAGLSAGVYQYAYTFVTASGESLPSSLAAIDVGALLAPPTTPIATATPEPFLGGVTGAHYWTYTFASASGETTGPAGILADPRVPVAATGGIGGVNDYLGGSFPPSSVRTYAVTYVGTDGGETTQAPYWWNAVSGSFAGGHKFEVFIGGFEGQGQPQYNVPRGVSAIKVYRSVEGAYSGPFYFVGNASIGDYYPDGGVRAGTFMDTGYALGAPMPTSNTAYATAGKVTLGGIALGPAGTVSRKIYRTATSGVRYVGTLADNVSTSYVDTVTNATVDAAALLPTVNTAGDEYRRVQLSNIAAGPTSAPAVTSRKVYRTAVGAAQLKLVTTLADNSTTSYLDAMADASLGANAPAGDTSGITQPAGQVPAGAVSIIVANAGAFPAAGWAIIGNGAQVIRFTAKTAAALTGIPATGTGAVTAAVSYNSTITAAPMLTGVGGLTAALVRGDEIYFFVRKDDTTRAAQVADMVNVGNGLREEWVQDRRLSMAEARNRAAATLALRPLEDVTITYTCRDLRTASGKTITVALPAPTNVSATLKIQHVVINNFRPHATQYPTFTVTASNRRFSFEDWLRRLETST